MFDKMKQLYELQKNAKEMQKSVEAIKIEKTAGQGAVQVVMNGAFQVDTISIADHLLAPSMKASLENMLKTAFNEAAEEAAKKSAAQTMELMKGMNIKIPGM